MMDKQLIPQLRFTINKKESYSFVKFGSVIKDSGYGPRFNGNDYDINGNVKTIRGTDISLDGEIKYNQVPIANLDETFVKNHILNDGDLVMITTADCGLTGVFRKQDIDFIPSAYAVKISLKQTASPIYFKYFFQTSIAKNQINRFVRKATVANLPGSDIPKLNINIPSLSEQQKIASFLSEVDDKITKLTIKKDLIKQYKKGVMQKIFNQELKFKDDDGNEFPKWEKKKLGELLDYEQPTKYIVESTEYNDSFKTPVLTAGKSFLLGYTNETDGIYNKVPTIIFDDFTMANKYVDFEFKVKSSAMKILQPKTDDVYIKFIYEAIQMINYPKGNEHKRFWISEYSKIKIGYPCKKEQIKIANFLSDIDSKIEALIKNIDNSVTFKKGLLQSMFV